MDRNDHLKSDRTWKRSNSRCRSKRLFAGMFIVLLVLVSPCTSNVAQAEGLPSTPRFAALQKSNQRQANGYKRCAREDWFLRQRSLPAAHIPFEAHSNAVLADHSRFMPAKAPPVRWESTGPGPIDNVTMYGAGDLPTSGRALTIAVHPSDPNTLLLGAAQGGIWYSTNGGRNFFPVADNMPSLAIKIIRFAPGNPDIVYAGSGEPHSKTSIFGMGVFKSTDGGQTWTALPSYGPGWDFRYVAISGLQVDPGDADTLYVTTANILPDRVNAFQPPLDAPKTGIFKSTDGGQTWKCMHYAVDYRKYMYPEWDPYLASGVGFMDLEMLLASPGVLFATEMSGGIYRSTDYGEHWTRITPVKNPGGVEDAGAGFPAPVPQFAYYDPNTFTFITYKVIPRPKPVPEFNRIELGLAQAGGGITPDYHSAVLYAGVGAVIKLDVNGNDVYDLGADLQAAVGLLFKSADGGDTWTWLGDWSRGIPNYCDTYGSIEGGHPFMDCLYDNTVEVNPGDPNDLVVGGNANYNAYWPDPVVNPVRMLEIPWSGMVYRSVDGGATWRDTTPACEEYVPDAAQPPINGLPVYACISTPSDIVIHPDVHSAAYDWANSRFYVTTDGGLHRCDVSQGSVAGGIQYRWTPLNNNLSTLQFFNFGPHPTDPDQMLGGMQDNAAAYWNGTFWDAWDASGGDGNVAMFDPLQPQYMYVGYQYALTRSDNGGGPNPANWKVLFDSSIGNNDTLPFVTIFEIDPVETNIVYVGSETGLYRSTDRGDTWQDRLNQSPLDGGVTAISVSPKDHTKVWAGTSTGKVYLFDLKKGKIYDRTGARFPNRWVSSIKASYRNASKVTVAFSGYDSNSKDKSKGGNGYVGRVFRSVNLGQGWTNMSGNLTAKNNLDVPASAITIDPRKENRMWIGTDIGVYQTVNNGITWTSYRGNMPVVAVMAIQYNGNTGYLMAATFGRSIWRILVP